MPTIAKTEQVAALKARIEGSSALLLAEHRGLTVSEIADLRRSLREVDASLAVVKNTLMRLAAGEAGVEELTALLSGPSAVAFINGDAVAAAKTISAVAKQHPALVVKGGWMDGRLLSADEARALAELESREVMLSKVAGLLQGEIARAAAMFQDLQSRFLSLLRAYGETLPPTDAEPDVADAPDPSVADEAADEADDATDEEE